MTTATSELFSSSNIASTPAPTTSGMLFAFAAFVLGANLRDSFATITPQEDAAFIWGM